MPPLKNKERITRSANAIKPYCNQNKYCADGPGSKCDKVTEDCRGAADFLSQQMDKVTELCNNAKPDEYNYMIAGRCAAINDENEALYVCESIECKYAKIIDHVLEIKNLFTDILVVDRSARMDNETKRLDMFWETGIIPGFTWYGKIIPVGVHFEPGKDANTSTGYTFGAGAGFMYEPAYQFIMDVALYSVNHISPDGFEANAALDACLGFKGTHFGAEAGIRSSLGDATGVGPVLKFFGMQHERTPLIGLEVGSIISSEGITDVGVQLIVELPFNGLFGIY